MSKVDAPRHDAVPIGEVAQAPFAVLPDPLKIFAERTQRLRALAQQSELAPYLTFLAALTEAQYRIQDDLPEPDRPPPDTVARARDFAMPPLDRNRFTADEAFDTTVERLLSLAKTLDMPPAARDALTRVAAQDGNSRDAMGRALLRDAVAVQ